MRRRTLVQALATGTLLLAACSEQREPLGPNGLPETRSVPTAIQGQVQDPNILARAVPGFGGFYLDADGTPVVYLKNAAELKNVAAALTPYLREQGLSPSQLRVSPARFEWQQLAGWQTAASRDLLGQRGAVFVDADESSNRVVIGVERGSAARFRGLLGRLGTPSGAVVVQEVERFDFAATLRDKVRPVVGGLQINFPGFLCTLGFNARRGTQNSFITNSHCTKTQGGVQSTPYWQALQGTTTKIGTEVSDPVYFTNSNGCPAGFKCRFSDAARAAYLSGTPFALGRIAKTTAVNTNSITINGFFTVTAEGAAAVGQVVSKVGRTTGWSRGRVTNSCVNVGVSGSNIGLLCQNIVSARVGAGDSGSPVFKGTGNVVLVGLLWGVNSTNTQFVYSSLANVERELGSLVTF